MSPELVWGTSTVMMKKIAFKGLGLETERVTHILSRVGPTPAMGLITEPQMRRSGLQEEQAVSHEVFITFYTVGNFPF